MTYYYYHLSSVIFCHFQNIFNESRSRKSMLILDDKTLTYLWRIKIISIYYFVVFYFGHYVVLPPNTFKLFRHPVFLFWVYLMKVSTRVICLSFITSGDKLYYTNYSTHTVTCCDLHSTKQWKFNDKCVLLYPCGISVDNNGNVYVVGRNSNNVVVIFPDGQRHRQLFSSKDGLKNPPVLDYDRSTNRLLVVNKSSTAFLFDVSRGK